MIFICHAQQIWELAGRILHVKNGEVRVEAAEGKEGQQHDNC